MLSSLKTSSSSRVEECLSLATTTYTTIVYKYSERDSLAAPSIYYRVSSRFSYYCLPCGELQVSRSTTTLADDQVFLAFVFCLLFFCRASSSLSLSSTYLSYTRNNATLNAFEKWFFFIGFSQTHFFVRRARLYHLEISAKRHRSRFALKEGLNEVI